MTPRNPSPTLSSRPGPRRFLERYGPLLALIVLFVGTAVLEVILKDPDQRAFLRPQNLMNIISQWSFVGIVAVGMTFVVILGGIDLSVGAIVALSGGAAIYVLNALAAGGGEVRNVLPAIVAACVTALAGGAFLGWVNGLVIAKGRIAPFVATLGSMAMFRALILARADGSEVRSAVPGFNAIGSKGLDLPLWLGGSAAKLADDGSILSAASHLTVRFPVIGFLVVALLGHLLLTKTSFGLNVYSIGGNTKAARYAGVKIARVTMLVYTLAGLSCGIAAMFASSRLNSVSSSTTGQLYELDAIAAVVIGGTRLQGGSGRVFGTVVGVLILGVVSNMLNMLDVSNFYHGLVKGLIIIAAVLVQPGKDRD